MNESESKKLVQAAYMVLTKILARSMITSTFKSKLRLDKGPHNNGCYSLANLLD